MKKKTCLTVNLLFASSDHMRQSHSVQIFNMISVCVCSIGMAKSYFLRFKTRFGTLKNIVFKNARKMKIVKDVK